MKEGWTFLNFEDCIEKCKKTKQLKTSDYLPEGKYPIVSQESDLISGYTNMADYVNDFGKPIVVFGDHSRVVKYIDFAFAVGADGVKILIPTNDFHPKFFYYYLHWHGVENLGYSRHYKLLKEINVPIPSLSEQQHIVEELDLLSSIIEKKKAQLNELDNLAQSLFYEMFGDPITNEKGWEIKTWKDVFETKTGKLNANAMVEGGKYPFFTCSKDISYIDTYAFDCEALLLAGNNASANYDVKYYKGKFNAYQRTYVLTIKEGAYPFYKISLEGKLSILQSHSLGGLTKYLTMGVLSGLSFIAPPISLQQQFASKIETIEHQKELIMKSIKEVETLYNSRMDFWFN